MKYQTDDLRIRELKELAAPEQLVSAFPVTEKASETVYQGRRDIHRILRAEDDRLVVVVGPCSIHDVEAAREYAQRLVKVRGRVGKELCIVMRVYFEKPRTTVGWKGLINDPHLDGSFEINDGLRLARHLLVDLADMGLPAGTEYLDLISPQYVADLIAWGAIGARTTESQGHRELASGLSCPVGFKNGTAGAVQIAVDAIRSAAHSHHFLSVTKEGHSAIFATSGNDDCHVILRGGSHPNYDPAGVDDAAALLATAGLPARIMIDCSHANSRKRPDRQVDVARAVAMQVARGDQRIFGVMLESHLVAGSQSVEAGKELIYGQSVTDACMGWQDTEMLLGELAEAVRARRQLVKSSG
ncbi:MAG: 3-deoxy-7-phosphoheptulonate synthase [Proteobacteria bacterium]|nr:MAG: 3-deoxy-7-phosphoheptulonate synthase [Pseudomonadota bacterium]